MKRRTIAGMMMLFLAAVAVCYASPQMGTWKLNEAKSKFPPGVRKNTTVVYAPAGGQVQDATSGTHPNAIPSHPERTGKLDGKDYPLTGPPTADTRSYTKVNDRTVDLA